MLINLHPTRYFFYRMVAILLILIMMFSKPVTSYAAADYNDYGYWFRTIKVDYSMGKDAIRLKTN